MRTGWIMPVARGLFIAVIVGIVLLLVAILSVPMWLPQALQALTETSSAVQLSKIEVERPSLSQWRWPAIELQADGVHIRAEALALTYDADALLAGRLLSVQSERVLVTMTPAVDMPAATDTATTPALPTPADIWHLLPVDAIDIPHLAVREPDQNLMLAGAARLDLQTLAVDLTTQTQEVSVPDGAASSTPHEPQYQLQLRAERAASASISLHELRPAAIDARAQIPSSLLLQLQWPDASAASDILSVSASGQLTASALQTLLENFVAMPADVAIALDDGQARFLLNGALPWPITGADLNLDAIRAQLTQQGLAGEFMIQLQGSAALPDDQSLDFNVDAKGRVVADAHGARVFWDKGSSAQALSVLAASNAMAPTKVQLTVQDLTSQAWAYGDSAITLGEARAQITLTPVQDSGVDAGTDRQGASVGAPFTPRAALGVTFQGAQLTLSDSAPASLQAGWSAIGSVTPTHALPTLPTVGRVDVAVSGRLHWRDALNLELPSHTAPNFVLHDVAVPGLAAVDRLSIQLRGPVSVRTLTPAVAAGKGNSPAVQLTGRNIQLLPHQFTVTDMPPDTSFAMGQIDVERFSFGSQATLAASGRGSGAVTAATPVGRLATDVVTSFALTSTPDTTSVTGELTLPAIGQSVPFSLRHDVATAASTVTANLDWQWSSDIWSLLAPGNDETLVLDSGNVTVAMNGDFFAAPAPTSAAAAGTTMLSATVTLDALNGRYDTFDFLGAQVATQLTLVPATSTPQRTNVAHAVRPTRQSVDQPKPSQPDVEPALRAGPISFGVETLNVGVPITAIQGQASWSGNTVSVTQLSGAVLGGQFAMQPGTYDLAAGAADLLLELNNVDLARMLELEGEKISGTGTLDAQLPMRLRNNVLAVVGGTAEARAPGGELRYVDAQELAANVGSSVDLVDALGALQDFRFNILKAGIEYGDDGNLELAVRLEGNNPGIQDGRPIHYNLNVTENVPDLLYALRLTSGVSESLERRLRERLQQ